MNTNSNVYTIIYTAIIVVVVAAVLSFAAMALKPMQTANVKADTISQIMAAAQIGTKAELSSMGNDAVLTKYSEQIAEAFAVNTAGEKVKDLGVSKSGIELIDNFKPQDLAIKAGADAVLPVYVFKSGITVIPVYGAGLWGPVWGYVALQPDCRTIAGAYFDHASETPGLGAKIKDDPSFQAEFIGKKLNLDDPANPFDILKGGAPDGNENAVDAITGATMTCNGLNKAIDVWAGAYAGYLKKATTSTEE